MSIDARQVKRELAKYVPADALRTLAAAGIRDEHVFPVPIVVETKPTLVGYYRLLLGLPQKTFYAPSTGMGPFKSMEASGTISKRQQDLLPELCSCMCKGLAELVAQIYPIVSIRDVAELPLLTLGQQFQGANNNKIGQQATREIFINVAIEIKGGSDKSNAHNRAGEAEKSHQKAKQDGFRCFWTLIALKGMDLVKLRKESPTTNEWFDVAQVLARNGADWERFREHLVQTTGIPLGMPGRRPSRAKRRRTL